MSAFWFLLGVVTGTVSIIVISCIAVILKERNK